MALPPVDDPIENLRRGIAALPAYRQLATFVPADPSDPNYAQFMELYGDDFDPERARAAWEATRLFSSPAFDGVPMEEIADAEARLLMRSLTEGVFPLSQVMEHSALYESQPWLADIPVQIDRGLGADIYGAYDPEAEMIYLNPRAPLYGGITDEEDYINAILRTLLHEGQHVIQYQNNLPGGANPAMGAQIADELGLDGETSDDAFRAYLNAPGEIIAQLVENRMGMSQEGTRGRYPGEDYNEGYDPEFASAVREAYDRLGIRQ